MHPEYADGFPSFLGSSLYVEAEIFKDWLGGAVLEGGRYHEEA